MAGAFDLVLDFATLGEYGLVSLPADGCCEQDGRRAGWEALATPHRGSRERLRAASCPVDFRAAVARFAG